jgi:hypothetical protein
VVFNDVSHDYKLIFNKVERQGQEASLPTGLL